MKFNCRLPLIGAVVHATRTTSRIEETPTLLTQDIFIRVKYPDFLKISTCAYSAPSVQFRFQPSHQVIRITKPPRCVHHKKLKIHQL